MPGMAVRRVSRTTRAPSGCRQLIVLCRPRACTSPDAVVAGAALIGRLFSRRRCRRRALTLLGCAPERVRLPPGARVISTRRARVLGRDGDGQMQDTVGVAGGEVLRVHALAEGQLAGERPLGPLGDDDLLAVAVMRGAFGRIVRVLCSTVTSMLSGLTPAGRPRRCSCHPRVVAAIPGAVDVHGHAERGTRPRRGHGQQLLQWGPGRDRT